MRMNEVDYIPFNNGSPKNDNTLKTNQSNIIQ